MVKKLSLAAIAVLATSTLYADSFDIEDALKSGSFGGDFTPVSYTHLTLPTKRIV